MVSHFIITNREVSTFHDRKNFIKVNDKEFIRKDGDEEAKHNLRYGMVSFDPKKAKKLEDYNIQIIEDLSDKALEKLKSEGKDDEIKKLGSTQVFESLYKEGRKAKGRQDILFFIHGFNSDLETAMETLRELHEKYIEPDHSPIKHIVIFTWPSKKKILRYRNDAQDALQSGYALARSYAGLKEFFVRKFVKDKQPMCQQKIHLLCHSMGNRVLEAMLTGLLDIRVEINSLFGEIILVGADIDYNALEQPKPLYRLIDFGERVHVYYHNNDQALGISELTKNAFNRLGRWGAKNSLHLPDDIYQSDVSDIQDDEGLLHDRVHHWYYYNSPSVVRDITEVIQGQDSVFTL
ncbi:alpha/beta hydrolase [Echinicola jeungdonensis]|uniref:Alpha/beta hydrolase n=1 Tax=Echinicola jeungdonensis TaxID=709343 RepID=A0ABV5J472_9BACT|nr:alpha/beta hydrolase [Echinicola jeungdonensis]MDN3670062.1 alpha/beta hydrolase [Echinicola jeungdonensis]